MDIYALEANGQTKHYVNHWHFLGAALFTQTFQTIFVVCFTRLSIRHPIMALTRRRLFRINPSVRTAVSQIVHRLAICINALYQLWAISGRATGGVVYDPLFGLRLLVEWVMGSGETGYVRHHFSTVEIL